MRHLRAIAARCLPLASELLIVFLTADILWQLLCGRPPFSMAGFLLSGVLMAAANHAFLRRPRLFWQVLFYYLIAVNVLAFVLMGIDKRRAKQNAWRIPEKTLFLPAILGGALGGVAGMRLFHHKTRHWYFKYGFPLLLILQLAEAGWCAWRFWA